MAQILMNVFINFKMSLSNKCIINVYLYKEIVDKVNNYLFTIDFNSLVFRILYKKMALMTHFKTLLPYFF